MDPGFHRRGFDIRTSEGGSLKGVWGHPPLENFEIRVLWFPTFWGQVIIYCIQAWIYLLIFYNFFDISGSNLGGSTKPPRTPLDPPRHTFYENSIAEIHSNSGTLSKVHQISAWLSPMSPQPKSTNICFMLPFQKILHIVSNIQSLLLQLPWDRSNHEAVWL